MRDIDVFQSASLMAILPPNAHTAARELEVEALSVSDESLQILAQLIESARQRLNP
jgi:hypothetical protein